MRFVFFSIGKTIGYTPFPKNWNLRIYNTIETLSKTI